MSQLLGRTPSDRGPLVLSPEPLGRGGEGSVFAVESHGIPGLPPAEKLVAKVYHDPSEGDRARKLVSMLTLVPDSSSLAWPLALVVENDKFLGYLMVKLDSSGYRSWAELSNIRDRRGMAKDFDVRYALTAGRNLAVAIHAIHLAGHRVGDVNESNIFVGSDASVFIVDTDSAQVVARDGTVFPCLVGKPEYTAAELTHGSLRDQERTEASDTFAYAVALFQMLTGGAHPTDGVWLDRNSEPPSVVNRVRQSVLPNLDPEHSPGFGPVARIPALSIPAALRAPMVQALQADPVWRPSLTTFIGALDGVLAHLVQCNRVPQHWYDSRDGFCGWCAHADAGNPDPWSREAPRPRAPSQTTLPSVNFQDSVSSTPAPRMAPQVPGRTSQGPGPSGGQRFRSTSQGSVPQPQSGVQPSRANGGPMVTLSNPSPQPVYPPHPSKIKGKAVLDYADGSWDVRPPYRVLLRANPRVAFRCMAEETPDFARAWWPSSRPLAHPGAAGGGLAIGVLLSLGLIFLMPWLGTLFTIPNLNPATQALVFLFWGLGSAGTGALASLSLAISAWRDRARTRKHFGKLDGIRREHPGKTLARFLPIPLLYGPILLFAAAVGLVLGLVQFILAVLRTNPR